MQRETPRTYQLRSLLFCGLCDRRMQGNWNNDTAYYRCRFPNEYGLANYVEHPRTVYVRENDVVPSLDCWLLKVFEPDNIDQTLDQLTADQQGPDDEAITGTKLLAECDRKLARYRAALEAGSDPAVVTEWIKHVQAERAIAEARTRPRDGDRRRLSREQIQYIVTTMTNLTAMIEDADPRDKAEIYSGLGLRLTYHPGRAAVLAEVRPATSPMCVRFVSKERHLPHAYTVRLIGEWRQTRRDDRA